MNHMPFVTFNLKQGLNLIRYLQAYNVLCNKFTQQSDLSDLPVEYKRTIYDEICIKLNDISTRLK